MVEGRLWMEENLESLKLNNNSKHIHFINNSQVSMEHTPHTKTCGGAGFTSSLQTNRHPSLLQSQYALEKTAF